MAYIGNNPGVASQRVVTNITATADQTTFTPSSGYTVGYIDVYMNGVRLINGSDYTASNGSTVVLSSGAAAGDVLELVAYIPRGLSDGYTKAEADARYMDINEETLPDQSGHSGQFLQTDGTTADWATVNTDLVSDTTPQLGGDLASNGNDITFGDNDKAIFGNSDDLQIYHNGSASYIDEQGTGNLILRGSAGVLLQKYDSTENMITAYHDDAVTLYHNGLSKLATTSTGVDVTGTVTCDGLIAPSYATDAAATAAGLNTAGSIYYNTTDDVLKNYNAQGWTYAGSAPVWTSTFDYLQDNSAVSLHRLNNSLADTGGSHNATFTGAATFVGAPAFGSHCVNLYGNSIYMDIPSLPRIYAVSFWAKKTGSSSAHGYLVDFRHDNPSNGRGYLYTKSSTSTIDKGHDSAAYVGDIYINGNIMTSTYTFPLDTWVHVVCSVNNASDGKQDWNQGLRFGNRSDGSTEGNFGQFDQIRTFNRPLAQADVTKLYNEQEKP